jgi:hypothetical protein
MQHRVQEDRTVWWISYRGESGHGVDNIGVFEDDGSPRKIHPLLLDPSPAAHPLHIARGFALVGDDLYIANAWRKDSHIACYHRHGDTFRFKEVLAKTEQVAAMVHPFDVELGDDGRIYISCQDTNTVVSFVPETRKPAPVAAHLRKHYPKGKFLPGTLVASSKGSLPEYGDRTSLDVPSPLGLKVVLDKRGKPRHSVRGIVVHRKHLYVADEAGDAVKVFNVQSGELMAHIAGRALEAPVHLILHGETLYRRLGHRQHPRAGANVHAAERQAQGARGDRRKARRALRLRRRPRRRSLCGRAEEAAGAALFLQGEEKGNVH